MYRGLCHLLLAITGCCGAAFSQAPAAPQAKPQTFTLGQLSSSLQRLSRRVTPAVVQVVTSGYYPVRGDEGGSVAAETGSGSGVILDPQGYIITNAHVIEGARRVRVLLAGTATAVGDVNEKLSSMLPELRRPAGVVVAALTSSLAGSTELSSRATSSVP